MTTPAHDENWFSENLNPNESGAFASLFKAYAEHYGKQLLADNADKSRRIAELEAALGDCNKAVFSAIYMSDADKQIFADKLIIGDSPVVDIILESDSGLAKIWIEHPLLTKDAGA